jgi:membrane fusion protein (multidrug efflux system)
MKMPPTPVEVAVATPETVREGFQALGSVESEDNIEVVSEIDGIVRALPFREGTALQRGVVLGQIDDREIRAERERAAALLDQARLNAERAQKLFERSALSAQELEAAETMMRVAQANLSLAETRLDKTTIRAPFAGLVGRERVSIGTYVRAGNVITSLARIDVLEVSFSAPERFIGRLRVGSAVDVQVPAFPDEGFSGSVVVVDPQVDPNTRTFQLVARIPNPGARLRPGMSASVMAILAERQNAIRVPDEAVFVQGDQTFVYVVAPDSSVQMTAVVAGYRDSSRVEIVSGLEPGQQVVRAGHQKLFPGAHVMPMPPGGAPAAGAPSASAAKK